MLGFRDQPFSITLWIQPQKLSGTVVHLSTASTGGGSRCFPLLGFASDGALVAQVLTDSGVVATVVGPVLQVPSTSWVLVVQTWSAANGLRLYVNRDLVKSVAAPSFLGSEATPNYLTLGNCGDGCGQCSSGLVNKPGPYAGAIDDWRVFSRELTSDDVCTLYSIT